jgi:hypothetical protein
MKSCLAFFGLVFLVLIAFFVGAMMLVGGSVKRAQERQAIEDASMTPEEREAKKKRLEHEGMVEGYKIAAIRTTKEGILERIKAPSTAKMDLVAAYTPGNETITVTGTVDAQNAFGTFLRHSVKAIYDMKTNKSILFQID